LFGVLVFGALLFHLGRTGELWLRLAGEPADSPWRLTALLATGAGALLMPSALLHTALRLWDSGLEARRPFDPRYALCYAPLAALARIPAQLDEAPGASLLEAVGPLVIPYAVWVSLVTLSVALGLFLLRDGSRRIRLERFLTLASGLLAGWTLLFWAACYLAWREPVSREAWVLAVSLGPTVVGLWYAHYVVRFHFWPLLAERTVALAAVASAVAAFHVLVLPAIREALPFRGLGLMALEVTALAAALRAIAACRQRLRRLARRVRVRSPAPR
jgi:hypothetical protein